MRPVNRGDAPGKYDNYEDAKQDLLNQLGGYCSYCERRIPTLLSVEHIQPKGLSRYAHLRNEWTNFLLACVNCNSAKSNKAVEPVDFLLPDRDNTFMAFNYEETGMVVPNSSLPPSDSQLAKATCDLVALNRLEHPDWKEDVIFSALERTGQRVQAWVQAKDARQDYDLGRTWSGAIAREASATGFFSIWMAAFDGVPEVRQAIIEKFPNTDEACFDSATNPVSPRLGNGLAHGGKI